MRPLAAEPSDSADRQAVTKRRGSGSPSSQHASNAPTSFFFRSEEDVEGAGAEASTATQDSTYGVQSIESSAYSSSSDLLLRQTQEDQLPASFSTHIKHPEHPSSSDEADPRPHMPPLTPSHSRSAERSAQSSPLRWQPPAGVSQQPLTPLHIQSPGPGSESAPVSTPKSVSIRSLRLSEDDDDGVSSQAVASEDEEEEEEEEGLPPLGAEEAEGAPQLVMPSLTMPRRRPFTERGRLVGKLKIMVAGTKGAGKTSLIKSIVRSCEDIVHVDTLSSLTPSMQLSQQTAPTKQRRDEAGTERITEIFASTRAYPAWWLDLEESRILKRRGSTETVLERNLCFVDTPGFQDSTAGQDYDLVVDYVESCLQRNKSFSSFSEGELLGIFSGSGGVQVDLVLFVLPHNFQPSDLERLKRLSHLTNVIPVIGKADLLSYEETSAAKAALLTHLLDSDVRPFFFGDSVADLLDAAPSTPLPHAVSSALSNDDDNMDASLLMSPDYLAPLAPSDLPHLMSLLFAPDTAARLRHTAARKFLTWLRGSSSTATAPTVRIRTPSFLPASPSPSTPSTNPSSPSLLAAGLLPANATAGLPFTTHARAAVAAHSAREPRLAPVQLARWAAELQRAVRNERVRFEALQQEERVRWLVERLEDAAESDAEVVGEVAVGVAEMGEPYGWGGKGELGVGKRHGYRAGGGDPLGLIEWDERVRRGGLVVAKVLGGCGIVGVLAVWWWRWGGWFHE